MTHNRPSGVEGVDASTPLPRLQESGRSVGKPDSLTNKQTTEPTRKGFPRGWGGRFHLSTPAPAWGVRMTTAFLTPTTTQKENPA